MDIKKRVDLSLKIYPYFTALTGDLLFWIAIYTVFLTDVKNFNALQISSLTTIGTLFSIITYPLFFRIINKIGNISCVKLGSLMFLIASLLLTISNTYILILIGYIIYTLAFLFKNMENVILKRNLEYIGKRNDYIKLQQKSSLIYSVITMIIALISGYLYNINNYLPMILCILFCFFNFILSHFLYEYKDNVTEVKKEKINLTLNKSIILIGIFYALIRALIGNGEVNSKLIIQYELFSFIEIEGAVLCFSVIIFLSRIVRTISNLIFSKLKVYKSNIITLYSFNYILIAAFILIIFGEFINLNALSVVIVTLGFFVFLAMRDYFSNYIRNIVLNDSNSNYENSMSYLFLASKIVDFIISLVITLILLKFDLVHAMIFLLLASFGGLFLIKKYIKYKKLNV